MGRKAQLRPAGKPLAQKKNLLVESSASGVVAKLPKVIPFYSDRPGQRFREFSNFFREAPPYRYTLPPFARCDGLPGFAWCEFSEKAIMLTKAALMGDHEMFREIEQARDPKACKALGRGVRNFDQGLWDSHLEEIAFEVVRQKFEADSALKRVLLSTGDSILAEAAPNDCIWGIGLSLKDDGVYHADQWRGRNILGYALMRARQRLREAGRANADEDAGAAAGPAAGLDPSLQASAAELAEAGRANADDDVGAAAGPAAGLVPTPQASAVELAEAGRADADEDVGAAAGPAAGLDPTPRASAVELADPTERMVPVDEAPAEEHSRQPTSPNRRCNPSTAGGTGARRANRRQALARAHA